MSFEPERLYRLAEEAVPEGDYTTPLGQTRLVRPGDDVSVELAEGEGGELWFTVNGDDPRLPGGEPADTAELAEDGVAVLDLRHSTVLRARVRLRGQWGPVETGIYEVREASPLVLNEWNAVGAEQTLTAGDFDGSGADDALGVLEGNGGAWIELVVTEDVDLRGWRLTMEDLRGPAGDLTFTDASELALLPAGTLLTVSAGLPEDASLDATGGDWRLQVTASPAGRFVQGEAFRVSAQEWQLTAWDAAGQRRFGPVGEGRSPRRGISAHEVGALLANPGPGTPADSSDYGANSRSTYAEPNAWEGGEQDFSALRGFGAGVHVEAEAPPDDEPVVASAGCASSAARPGWMWTLALLALSACARGSGGGSAEAPRACVEDLDGDGSGNAAVAADCEAGVSSVGDCDDTDPSVFPGAPEPCNGLDDDCNGLVDDAPVDPLPFYADLDGDGWGDAGVLVQACAAGDGAAAVSGDCNDADADVHPGAVEGCFDIDRDCDGVENSGFGTAPACAAASCVEILDAVPTAPDGAYWLSLPSATLTEVWCDMDTGGWMLGFNRNTASTGSQGAFGGAEEGLDAIATSPELASASAAPAMGWLDLNALAWEELRLTAASSGARSYTSRSIDRGELRIAFGEPGYLLYGGESGYYWCGGPASYTDAGVGAVNNPPGATPDCKGHGSLGSGWDFSEYDSANAGLTLCGGDGSYFLAGGWGGPWLYYGAAGGAEAIWVR